MKLNIKKSLYLPVIFFFLPSFSWYIPFLDRVYAYFFIVLYAFLLILFIRDNKNFILKIKDVCEKTPLKYGLIFFAIAGINSILLSFAGVTSIQLTIRTIIVHIFLCALPVIFYFIYLITEYMTLKKFMKIFVSAYYMVMFTALVGYIGQLFDIEIINGFFQIFANSRALVHELRNINSPDCDYIAFNLPRLDGFFEEPSFYARFVFIFLPLIYSVKKLNIKYTRSRLINAFISNTAVPFAWLSLILTQSPIYLVLCGIFTFFYHIKPILRFAKRYSIALLLCACAVLSALSRINFEDTYISRILNVVSSVNSIDALIEIEGSLGTRLVNFYNTLCVFLKHPFGVGMGNVSAYLFPQMFESKLPLTPEIQANMLWSVQNNQPFPHNTALVYYLLASGGIFVFLYFVYFHIKIFKSIKKSLSCISDAYYKSLGNAFAGCWSAMTVIFFYHLHIMNTETLFLYSLMVSFVYILKTGCGKIQNQGKEAV